MTDAKPRINTEYDWAHPTIRTGDDIAALIELAGVQAWPDEDALQAFLYESLTAACVECFREYVLADGRSRVDIFVPTRVVHGNPNMRPHGIAVEVKIKGTTADVFRQLERYARCSDTIDLVLVTTKALHTQLPPTLEYKPLAVVPLLEGGL